MTPVFADSKMIVYKVFSKDYEHEKVTLLGMLAERRRDLRGKTRLEAGLAWARLTFGGSAKDKESIFIVPKELKAGHATRVLMKRTIFYKDGFWISLILFFSARENKCSQERLGLRRRRKITYARVIYWILSERLLLITGFMVSLKNLLKSYRIPNFSILLRAI